VSHNRGPNAYAFAGLYTGFREGLSLLKNSFVSVSGPQSGTRNADFGPFLNRFEVVNRPNTNFFNSLVCSRQLGEYRQPLLALGIGFGINKL
jgi:hypothetical protein